MRRLARILKWTVVGIVFLFAQYAYWPTWPDPRDDQCIFGTVTNDRYQQFVDAALTKKDSGEWQPIPMWFWRSNAVQHAEARKAFRARVDAMLPLVNSNNERVAAIHAAMRVSGGRHDPRHGRPASLISTHPSSRQ
jgi:hypothetical protein